MAKLLEQIGMEKKPFRLGDLVKINERSLMSNSTYSEIEYVDTSSVTENRFNKPEVLCIKDAPSRAKRLVKDGDTIISTVRPNLKHYGFIKNSKENTVVSTGFAVLTPKSIDPFYLFSYLTQDSITSTLAAIAETTTTTFPAFRPEVLADMEIEVPDLPTQKKIASILSAYDAKIENNNFIIKKLEATAQTLFDEWFVNFKFPGYEKVKIVDSEMGKIPEEWEIKNLNNISDIVFGFNFKSNLFNEDGLGIPIVRIRDILSGATKTYSPEVPTEEYEIKSGDLLIGMDGTFHCAFWYGNGTFLNQRVARVRSDLPGYFIYEAIREQLNFLQKTIIGATVGHLSNGDIRGFKIIIPKDKSLLKVFESITNQALNLRKENETLKSQRDQLLVKLI